MNFFGLRAFFLRSIFCFILCCLLWKRSEYNEPLACFITQMSHSFLLWLRWVPTSLCWFFFFCSGSVKLQTCWSRCDKCWFLKDRVQTVNTDDQQFALQLNARLHSSNSGFSVLKLYTLTITDVTWFLCYFAVRCASDMSSHDIITLSGVFPWCCGVAAGRTDFLWFSNVRLVEQETVKGVK